MVYRLANLYVPYIIDIGLGYNSWAISDVGLVTIKKLRICLLEFLAIDVINVIGIGKGFLNCGEGWDGFCFLTFAR